MTLTDSEVPGQAEMEWALGAGPLMGEAGALFDEIALASDSFLVELEAYIQVMEEGTFRADSIVGFEAYRQAMRDGRIRADSILGKWRALPRSQDPRAIEIDRLCESALMDVVAAFDEAHAFCDDFDDKRLKEALEHLEKCKELVESFGKKVQRATELLERLTEWWEKWVQGLPGKEVKTVRRAIRLVEGRISRKDSLCYYPPETQRQRYPSLGRFAWLFPLLKEQGWRLRDEQGQLVTEMIDKEPIIRLEEQKDDLEERLTEARAELAQSRTGLRSLFASERRREELEREVASLEEALQEKRKVEKTWYCISFHPEDNPLWDADPSGDGGTYFAVYMTATVFEKAQAFQNGEPIHLGTLLPYLEESVLWGNFWWYRDQFWVSTMYSEEEARLLLWEKGRREQRKLERLAKAMAAAKEACEEAGRERIPEEVRLLVWERDGGCCVKCGSTEDLEFDHIIPVSKGGSNTEKNVQLLCANCNREKGGRIA